MGIASLFDVDDVHTSQEAHLWTSSACYRDIIILLYVDDVRTSHISKPLRPVTGIALFFSIDGIRTSQEAHVEVSAVF
jgi:hypothetical protein